MDQPTGGTVFERLWRRRYAVIVGLALTGICLQLLLLALAPANPITLGRYPLRLVMLLGGLPMILELAWKALHREFGADLLAAIAMAVAWVQQEYWAGALVVLMLSGGQTLESFAVRRASAVLAALAKRMPLIARKRTSSGWQELSAAEVQVGDPLVILPHEVCPVDARVVEGHGSMDEAYLTGEPYRISKGPGAAVLSGAINGESTLVVEATSRAVDSRYSRIMEVMQAAAQRRPTLRRLGDQLGAWYTPLALIVAGLAGWLSGEPRRFLAVLVTATPCPLLIAIPVAILGAISLAARRGIVIRDPAVLENLSLCRTILFDKTGTLTYGQPTLVRQVAASGWQSRDVLQLSASLEQYSRHPLAAPILAAARKAGLALQMAEEVQEKPGLGLLGKVGGRTIQITGRSKLPEELRAQLPAGTGGLECIVLIDGQFAGLLAFRDRPRHEGAEFIKHLGPHHQFDRLLLVSGDREEEVRYLADQVGITEVHASATPEEKVAIVKAETAKAKTIFLGDGINDAPALLTATVGIAMGQTHEVTTQAAGAVIMNQSLKSVDELLHIGAKMRRIALQSAVGGMIASLIAMLAAAMGWLLPAAGALVQELIDVVVVLNALRTSRSDVELADYVQPPDTPQQDPAPSK